MAVRIGRVEIRSIAALTMEEGRTLVEQRVPEQAGAVFQDLGRDPVTILLDGELFGDAVLDEMEDLRRAQAKAQPLPFASDIAAGSALTEVIIQDLRIEAVAGFRNHYRFAMRLREYIAPPRSAKADLAKVQASVVADGAGWNRKSLAAAGALRNPAALPALLEKQPGLLDALSMKDLGGAIAARRSRMPMDALKRVFDTVKAVDPVKALQLVQSLRNADSLGELLERAVKEGVNLLGDIPGSELAALFTSGLGILKRLADLAGTAAGAVDLAATAGRQTAAAIDRLAAGKPAAPLPDLVPLVDRLNTLVRLVHELLAEDLARTLPPLAVRLKAQAPVSKALATLARLLKNLTGPLAGLRASMVQFDALVSLLAPLAGGTLETLETLGEALRNGLSGEPALAGLAGAVGTVADLAAGHAGTVEAVAGISALVDRFDSLFAGLQAIPADLEALRGAVEDGRGAAGNRPPAKPSRPLQETRTP